MMKLLVIFFISVAMLPGAWINCNIGDNMSVQFPAKPKIDNSFKDLTSYLSNNQHCDFSVDISKFPEVVFPKNEKEMADLLKRSVENSKEKGTFISESKFVFGKIKGMEIKSWFIPEQTIKLIEVKRMFFLNYKKYTLRCLYRIKNESVCEKDCKRFFSSLKFNGNQNFK